MPRVALKLNDRAYQRLLTQKRLDGFGDRSLQYWLTWKFQDVELSPGLSAEIRRGTRSQLAPMWMKNLAQNLPMILKSNLNLRTLAADEPIDRKCVVIGRGPSVFRKGHLKIIRESDVYQNGELTTIACDGIFKDCLREGLIPDYVTTVDGAEVVEKWYTLDPDLEKLWLQREKKPTKAVISTQTHPSVVDLIENLHMPIYWFQPATDSVEATHSVTRRLMLLTCHEGNPDGVVSLDCGGQVGTMSWVFSWVILKHSNVCLVGMDCGYPKDMPLDETYYWDTALSSLPALRAHTFYEPFTNPDTGEEYVLDPVFKCYREAFRDFVYRTPDWLDLANASSGTLYFPPYLRSVDLEAWLAE